MAYRISHFRRRMDQLQRAWQCFVDVLRIDGDFGGVASVDPDEIKRWVGRVPGSTKAALTSLLEAIADDAHDELRNIVGKHSIRPRLIAATQSGWRTYALGRDYVELDWTISEGGTQRVVLLLRRGETASSNAIEVQSWFRPRRARQPALRRTGASTPRGFRTDVAWPGWYFRAKSVPIDVSPGAIRKAILGEWRSALRAVDRANGFSQPS